MTVCIVTILMKSQMLIRYNIIPKEIYQNNTTEIIPTNEMLFDIGSESIRLKQPRVRNVILVL